MKKRLDTFGALGIITCLIFFPLCLSAQSIKLTILHTNDLHSSFDGLGPDALFTSLAGDKDPVIGNYSRLLTMIKKQREEKSKQGPVLLLDAGDFFAGSLYHLLAPRTDNKFSPELDFFIEAGYDFSTLGNHEFDPRPVGLANMIGKIKDRIMLSPFRLISSNLMGESAGPLGPLMGDCSNGGGPICPYAMKKISFNGVDLNIGFLGILGPDAALVSKKNRRDIKVIGLDEDNARPAFKELYLDLQSKVDVLKRQGAQVVILLAHAGEPEDEKIAKNVNDIDLIIAGHTHQLYSRPKKILKTWIVQAGSHGRYLGDVQFDVSKYGLNLIDGEFNHPINDEIASDPAFLLKMNEYQKELEKYKSFLSYGKNEQIGLMKKDYPWERGRRDGELGHLVCQGILQELNLKLAKNESGASDQRPVDVYFTTASLIRSSLRLVGSETPVLFSDVFRMLPIGLAEDLTPGTPVVHFFLNESEVRMLINFLHIYSHFSSNFYPSFSPGLKYEIRTWGIPMFNRLKDLHLNGLPFAQWPELIHVATTEYIADYVDKVGPMSYGLVKFVPKDQEGRALAGPLTTQEREYRLFADFLKDKKTLE